MIEHLREPLTRHMTRLFPCPPEKREPLKREFFDSVIAEFGVFSDLGLRDENFDRDFVNGSLDQFYARFWEIEIALHFHRLGYTVSRSKKNLGPDFLVSGSDACFFVEARILNPTRKLQDHIVEKPGKPVFGEVPADEILLRYTQALVEKKAKVQAYFARFGDPGYPTVIAINAYRAYPFIDGAGTHFPFAVRAVLPYGKLYMTFDTKTFETIDQGMQYRSAILKAPQSPVPTDVFLRPEWHRIAAVMATHRMFEKDKCRGLVAVHNPKASPRLEVGLLGVRAEYVTEVFETTDSTIVKTSNVLLTAPHNG